MFGNTTVSALTGRRYSFAHRFPLQLKALAVLLLIGGTYTSSAWAVVCPDANYNLNSQAAVDAFPAGCDAVTGEVRIFGADIVNLDGLAALKNVGNLFIEHNAALNDLQGLAALENIGGYFYLKSNASLSNVGGLSALKRVGQNFSMEFNPMLSNLDGLAALEWVNRLEIFANDSLAICTALRTLLDTVDDGDPGPGVAPIPDVGSSAYLQSNLPGCNSVQQIVVSAAYSVAKDFDDDNDEGVTVSVTCTDPNAVVLPRNGNIANEATPASYLIVGFDAVTGTTCTATETPVASYDQAASSTCTDVAITDQTPASCQLVNEQKPILIQASVVGDLADLAISCQNVGNVSPASAASPAEFTVNDVLLDGTSTCSVIMPSPPPGLFVVSNTCTDLVLLPTDAPVTCELVTATTRATFKVTKHFDDGNDVADITVSIACNTGLILDQDKTLSDGESVEFVVTDFTEGSLACTISEEGEAGYSPVYDNVSLAVTNSESCAYAADEIMGDSALECVITNHPDPVVIHIHKDWVFQGNSTPDIDTSLAIVVGCDSEIVDYSCPYLGLAADTSPYDSPQGLVGYPYVAACEGTPGIEQDVGMQVQVIPNFPNTQCTVEEYFIDQSIEQDNGCGTFNVSVGKGYNCIITNTVFFEGVPTLSQSAMALLALLMLGMGLVGFRRYS